MTDNNDSLPLLFGTRPARRHVLKMPRHEAFANYLVRSGFDFTGYKLNHLASAQLQRELEESIVRDATPPQDGTAESPLYTKLPAEIRLQIFSYLIVVPESIHLHPVKGNARLGFRLSRCGDGLMNFDTGHCGCQDGLIYGQPPANPPAFLDSELLLVSKTVRREALDLIFSRNHFTFTGLRDLSHFTEHFGRSAAKFQHIQVLERCSDGWHNSWQAKAYSEARAKIGHLQSLTLHLLLDHFSHYETTYPDGFIQPLLPLYFGHPEPPDVVIVNVRNSRFWGDDTTPPTLLRHVKDKLQDVFRGKWQSAEDVPMAEAPKRKVPQSEREPEVRKGLLILGD